MLLRISTLFLIHVIGSIRLDHKLADTKGYNHTHNTISDDESHRAGYFKMDPKEFVLYKNSQDIEPPCAIGTQCIDDAIVRRARRTVSLIAQNAKLDQILEGILQNMSLTQMIPSNHGTSFHEPHIPVVEKCEPTRLTNYLSPADKPGIDATSGVTAALSTAGTVTSAIGGVLTIGFPTAAAAAGPVGLVAIGAGLAIVSTFTSLLGSSAPSSEEIRNMISANNDELLDAVDLAIGDLAKCVNAGFEATETKRVYSLFKTDVGHMEAFIETMAAEKVPKFFHITGHLAVGLCLKISSYTDQVEVGDISAEDAALVLPMVKAWYDQCRTTIWALLTATAMEGSDFSIDHLGVEAEQSLFERGSVLMKEFANFYKLVLDRVSEDRDNHKKNTINGYWYGALSEETMFRYLKEHSLAGLKYPNVYATAGPDHVFGRPHKYLCRVCSSYSHWKVIGSREETCVYGEDHYGGSFYYLSDCLAMLEYGDTEHCERSCVTTYFIGSQKVDSLPAHAKSYGSTAAEWRGDEKGYWQYGCVETIKVSYFSVDSTVTPPRLWWASIFMPALESCHQDGGTLVQY